MKGITSAPKHINCASVRPKVERADVSASALRSKYFVGAGITLQLELHKLRRPTQDDNETTVVNKNDTMFYFVLAFCQEGGYLFDSYIPVRSCLSIAASVP